MRPPCIDVILQQRLEQIISDSLAAIRRWWLAGGTKLGGKRELSHSSAMALLGTLTWHEKFIHDSFFIVIPGLGGDIYVCSWTPSANSVVYLCYYLTACGVVALRAYSLIVPCYIERLYCSEEKNLVMIRSDIYGIYWWSCSVLAPSVYLCLFSLFMMGTADETFFFVVLCQLNVWLVLLSIPILVQGGVGWGVL